MKYINELREGNRMSGVYLCKHKQSAVTKNGKQYENVILQDRTGTIDAKIWDPNSMGIDEFEALDYVDISGDITDLSNYFVTSEGNNFFTVFSAALSKAQALGAPLKIQTI